jgi:hypothetical protein
LLPSGSDHGRARRRRAEEGYQLLFNPAGHIVCFGWANMVGGKKRNLFEVGVEFFKQPKFSPMQMMNDNKTVSGVNLGHLWNELDLLSGASTS